MDMYCTAPEFVDTGLMVTGLSVPAKPIWGIPR
jgi:hypothetical protein